MLRDTSCHLAEKRDVMENVARVLASTHGMQRLTLSPEMKAIR